MCRVCFEVSESTTAYVRVKKSSIKYFVEGSCQSDVSSDVTQWLNCIVGNVGARFSGVK